MDLTLSKEELQPQLEIWRQELKQSQVLCNDKHEAELVQKQSYTSKKATCMAIEHAHADRRPSQDTEPYC